MNRRKTIWALIPLMAAYLFSLNKPFFWDTIHLASAQAIWFDGHGTGSWLLPDEIDSGHPPLTGWLLACTWKVFGKGLWQSHLMMLPFLLIMVWQMLRTLRFFFPDHHQWLAFLFFLNPILLTQSMLVSPDIILFAGFFTALNGILYRRPWAIMAGATLLALVSMRGMVCVAALALFGLLRNAEHRRSLRAFLQFIGLFLPAAVAAGAFLFFHYQQKGWFGYHAGSPWSPSFETVDGAGFLKNLVIMAWRFSDQGMLFLWLFPLVLWLRKMDRLSGRTRELLMFFAILFGMLVAPQLMYKGLLMHRYLYPSIAMLTLAAFSIASEKMDLRNYVIASCILLVSGYFWIYPEPVSKGWDIMPLHASYYHHREKIMEELRRQRIDPRETGAGFPYEMPSAVISLDDDERHFAAPDLAHNRYVLYSNISNDFTEAQIQNLQASWTIVASSGRWPVYFILYKKP